MQHIDLKDAVITILSSVSGQFMSAYQICHALERDYKSLWDRLVAEYPSADPGTPMGEGTGVKFSPATFVANALAAFARKGTIQGLHQELLSCEGVSFAGTDPGYTGHVIGIWAIKRN